MTKSEKRKAYMASRKEAPKRFSLGYVREDGLIFWSRSKGHRGGEWWVTKEKFEAMLVTKKENEAKRVLRLSLPQKKWSAGQMREDGMVYWGRSRHKGDMWVSAVEFRELREKQNDYRRKRWAVDAVFRKSCVWRRQLRRILFVDKPLGRVALSRHLGCSREEFREHIQSLFKEGMTWSNHGEWHLDHVIPCVSANTVEELSTLFHFSNIQPLWSFENHIKYTK